jgi:hypothetical protein
VRPKRPCVSERVKYVPPILCGGQPHIMPQLESDDADNWAMSSALHPEEASFVPGHTPHDEAPTSPASSVSPFLYNDGNFEPDEPDSDNLELWYPNHVRIYWRAGSRVEIDLQHGAASTEMG